MARLHLDEIMSVRAVLLMQYPESTQAINDYAGRLLHLLRDKHLKDEGWNERQATKLERELDTLDRLRGETT